MLAGSDVRLRAAVSHRQYRLSAACGRRSGSRGTCSSSSRPASLTRHASSTAHTGVPRSQTPFARFRSYDAEKSNLLPRHGYRFAAPGNASRWPNIRYASLAVPAPRGSARLAHQRQRPSRGENPADRAFQELVVAHQPAGKRQLRKLRITAHVEIHPSIIEVGIAALQQPLDEREHGRQLLRRADKVIGHDDVDGVHFAHKALRLLPPQLIPGDIPQLTRPFKQGIIDIGDIFHVHYAQPLRTQIADQDVKGRKDEGMPKMGGIIGRYPAHVEFYFVITRNEGLDLLAEAVEELHGIAPHFFLTRPRWG